MCVGECVWGCGCWCVCGWVWVCMCVCMRERERERERDSCLLSCYSIHSSLLKVQKLLTMYTPAHENEDRVPAAVIRLVAQKSGADSTDPLNLMVDNEYIFPFTLPSPSSSSSTPDISFKNLSLPPSLSHLSPFLSTVEAS